jgi:hypothetical protein
MNLNLEDSIVRMYKRKRCERAVVYGRRVKKAYRTIEKQSAQPRGKRKVHEARKPKNPGTGAVVGERHVGSLLPTAYP